MREDKARHYRNRAEEARAKAETVTNESVRQTLLRDAELWERMAAYEEQQSATTRSAKTPTEDS
jgi:hypothetical protein